MLLHEPNSSIRRSVPLAGPVLTARSLLLLLRPGESGSLSQLRHDHVVADELKVRIAPPEHGWLDVTIEAQAVSVSFTASYTPHDSVTELAAALVRLVDSGASSEVMWNQEPDKMRIAVGCEGAIAQLRIEAVAEPGPAVLLTHEAPAAEIVIPFAVALDAIRNVMVDEQYEAGWRHPFPHAAVNRLLGRES